MLTLRSGGNSTEVRWLDKSIHPDAEMKNTSFFICSNTYHDVELHNAGDRIVLTFNNSAMEVSVPGGFYLKGDMYVGGVPGM